MLLEKNIQQYIDSKPHIEYKPDYNPKGYPNQKALFIQGPDYHGKPTKAFGYVGFPEGTHRERSLPAVVLVHGGGGYAFPGWVKKWTDRGYAAIALSNTGFHPTNGDITEFDQAISWKRQEDMEQGWISGPDNDTMANSEQDLNEQWMYHAVILTILAHNLLRQNARIDVSRIGLTGIS